MTEHWRPVPGYEGTYEVSDRGQVRSVDRYVHSVSLNRTSFIRGRVLKLTVTTRGYPEVGLWKNNCRVLMPVHRVVMAAFVGPLPEGMQTRHLNGQPTDNRLENLAYGTVSENMLDIVRHGRHKHAVKTECINGHQFNAANTYFTRRGGRRCRACKNAQARAARLANKRGDVGADWSDA